MRTPAESLLVQTYKNIMKRTFVIAMLAVSLFGAQAFAADGTKLEGGFLDGDKYLGVFSDTENTYTVTISPGSEDYSNIEIWGCENDYEMTNVTMTGGAVKQIIGRHTDQDHKQSETLTECIITMEGGLVDGDVVGGLFLYRLTPSERLHELQQHTINISDGTVMGDVIGNMRNDGISVNVFVSLGKINISGGTIGGAVIAGMNTYGAITACDVEASDVRLNKGVTGGVTANGVSFGNYAIVKNCVVAGDILGGQATGKAYDNQAIITESKTGNVIGGVSTEGDATNNIVSLVNSTVLGKVIGGESATGDAKNNTITVAGGIIEGEVVLAQAGQNRVATDNKLILIGSGAQYKGVTGDNILIKNNILVGGGGGGESGNTGNAIDIYGTGISIENQGQIFGVQELNFFLTNNLVEAEAPMLTMDSVLLTKGIGYDLELNFNAAEALDWKPGDSVTLVSTALGIQLDPSLLAKEYDIKYTDPVSQEEMLTAIARLELIQDGTTLKLTVTGNIPEPTTGTLSLLALTALAVRRRRRRM